MFENLTVGNIFAIVVLLSVVTFGFSAIPSLIRELVFYSLNRWNLNKDSKKPVAFQAAFMDKFEGMPVGKIKLRILVSRVGIGAVPIIGYLRAVYFRH